MEYQVPQFIEVEDKIFGPLTLKQFIYLAGGVGVAVALALYLPLIVGLLIGLPFAALGLALAFYKVNGKPFLDIVEAGFYYYLNRRLYLWHKEAPKAEAPVAPSTKVSLGAAPVRQKLGLSESKLHELAYSLDSNAPLTSHQ